MIDTKFIATHAQQISDSGGFYPKNPAPTPSPCVNICRLTPDRSYCLGCFRSLEEITTWAQADNAQRRRIWVQLLQRSGLALPPDLQA